MRGSAWLGVLVALALAAPTHGKPTFSALANTPLPSDPAVHTGVLANGLRYAVIHVEHPKGAISIRLGVDVGSFEESDTERGVAHFIEHMAFRNTRAFPRNSVDGAFAPRGVAFGRDHNAATELFATKFQIDLPNSNDADVSQAFTWLRDVADGVVFDSTAVDTERGVVLAEKETREGPSETAYEALLNFEAPGLRSFNRSPIGTEEILRTVSPETLQAFYRRWYRPDNAIVVMSGDLPVETMEARIKAAFGTWTASGPPAVRAPRTPPAAHRELDAFTRADPAIFSAVDVCKLQPAETWPAPQTLGQIRTDALGQIWRSILNQRLVALHLQNSAQVLGAQISIGDGVNDHRSTCLSVMPLNDGWEPALAAAEKELLRFQKSGPTDREMERAIESVRSGLRAEITAEPNTVAPSVADTVLNHLLARETPVEPRESLRAYDLAVEDLTVADVRQAFDRDWSGSGPLISVMAPRVPSPEEVKTAWLTTERGPGLAAYTDQEVAKWGYTFTAGDVASREVIDNGQFVRLRFKNGVVLNFKQTTFSKNNVSLVVQFGHGRKEIANSDYLMANLGGAIVAVGGLGRHSYDELGAMMVSDARKLQLHVGHDSFIISDDVSLPNLPDKLTVTAAYLSDPAFRPVMDPILHETGELTYRTYASSPNMTVSMALVDSLAPGSPIALPPKSTFLAMDSRKLGDILKPSMTRDPIEVNIVGDLDEKAAVQMVAGSFGALPPRNAPVPVRTDTLFFRFPAALPSTIRVLHQGPGDKAAAEIVWPLYVAEPARRREEYALRLLAATFSDELRKRVRGELGKTYSPTVETSMPDYADQGSLSASVETYPADMDAVITEVRSVATRLAAGDIKPEALEAVRAPLLANSRQAMQTNSQWAQALAGSSTDGQGLIDVLGFNALISSITLDEVKKAAAEWLTRPPIVAISTPAKPAGGGATP